MTTEPYHVIYFTYIVRYIMVFVKKTKGTLSRTDFISDQQSSNGRFRSKHGDSEKSLVY